MDNLPTGFPFTSTALRNSLSDFYILWPWRGNFASDLILCHKSWIVTHIFIMSFSVSLSGIYPLSCWKIIFFTYGHFPCSPPVSGSIAGRIRNPQYCRSRRHSNANSKIHIIRHSIRDTECEINNRVYILHLHPHPFRGLGGGLMKHGLKISFC